MSDPHQATASVNSLLETLLADNDEQQYGPSSTLDIMVEKGPRWLEWDTVDFTLTEKAQIPPPPSDSGHRDGWINDVEEQPPLRKQKRNFKQTGCWRDVEDGACNTELVPGPAQAKERQRGKNWEKAEEDILVNCKSKEMDWKSISECLQEHGYTRNHKHCADKWYALRKHYLEIHQWIVENPITDYWSRTDSEKIRSVPPSFCRTWYLVFDAVENKEGKKKVINRKKGAESPRPTTAGLEFSQPSCSVREYPGCSSGVVETQKREFCSDGDEPLEMLFSNRAATKDQANFNVQVLVTEIYNLSRALTVKFAAEEEVRSRSLAIKEKKLELKVQRFEFKRKRDEEIRGSVLPRLRRQGL